MSNALLAMSGPAFGNMDVTVYDVYTVTSNAVIVQFSDAITLFSDHPWTWAFVDLQNSGAAIMRPFAINNSVSLDNRTLWANHGSDYITTRITLTGTSTSLRGGSAPQNSTTFWTITVYVPSA